MRVEHPPHPCQRLLLSVFLITAILVGVKLNLIVVLICISFMTDDAVPLFLCLQPRVCLLQRTVYLACLHVFELGYLSFYYSAGFLLFCFCFFVVVVWGFCAFCFLR